MLFVFASVLCPLSSVFDLITVELAAYFYKLFGNIHQMVVQDLDIIGWEEKPGDGSIINADRRALRFGYYATRTIRFSLMVALVLACTLSFFTILHMMSSFRNNLYSMYRGDFSVIPPPEDMGPVALCTGSIKFAGYQVAYFVWAYIVTFGILGLVCIAIGFIVHLFLLELTDFIVHILEQAGPSLGIGVFMMIAQWLLARFIFLQDKGQYLRLDNRRFYFVFTYFFFFFNIFIGLVSCLMRILKAIGVGMLFLGRLDNSTLPRKFEFFDPGFAAYQGFIHMEAAHTHPVVNVFIRLLASESRKRKRDNLELKEMRTDLKNGSPVTRITKVGHQRSKPINVGARFNWLVTYTLLHNPTVRIYRRGYVQAMKKARLAGIKIPISDKPITTFDLVKTDEEREQEKQEELLKIESLKAASSFRNSTRYDTGVEARQERWANRRDRVQRQETVDTDQESITDEEGSTGSDETPKQRPLATKDIQLKLERLEHIV
ncbi:stimulated by retinoic acid 6 protein [Biomphalaria glabrata]|nr:stimulated by retinoic acid gene 6 protein-like [Biomphalaria glabrata]